MSDNGATNRLQKLFNFSFKKDTNGLRTVYPAYTSSISGNLEPVKMSSDIMRYYNEWKNDLVRPTELQNRMQRYADLDFMIVNCGYIGTAVKLYSNETISPDESGKIINVYARDKKVENYINEFFQRIGINRSVLENTSYDIAKYSDHFWIRSISPTEGIYEIVPIDVRQVKDRLEFSAIEELAREMNKNNWQTYNNTSIRISDVADALTDKVRDTDYAAMYKKYLFGFSLGDTKPLVLPPWAVSHFRRFSTQSEFAPFGRPLLMNSLGIFREYKADLSLLAMARVAKFPKEVYTVDVDENMSPAEKLLVVNEARQEYQNLVDNTSGKEDIGIGSTIWTTSGIDYKLWENNMDLGEVADVDLVKDELITSTLIPKGYLITGENSWGNSGKALLQQSKVFAREVYTNQTAILTELTDLVKTQFVLMNLFEKEDTDFELSLAFPNSEQTAESIAIQKDTMDLANAVINNLETALAIDSIPPDVAKDIFKTYSSIDTKDLDSWFNKIKNSTSLQVKQADDFEKPEYKEKLNKAINRLNEKVYREAYFDAKKGLSLVEGSLDNKHFMMSNNTGRNNRINYSLIREFEASNNAKIED